MSLVAEPSHPELSCGGGSRALARAVGSLARGGAVVLLDDVRDASDIVVAAARITAEQVNMMAREACGLVALALTADQVDRLRLRPMANGWEQPCKPFTVSVDARSGITTGISAAERAHTIRIVVAPGTTADDLVVPGHVFPLRAGRASYSQHPGRTEAALELVRLAEQGDGAAICEILDEEGELADLPTARGFARRLGLPVVTTSALGSLSVDRAFALPRPPAHPRGAGRRDVWEEAVALARRADQRVLQR